MTRIRKILRRIYRFVIRENLHRVLIVLVLLMAISTAGMMYFEPGIDLKNALWWSIVTLTTVGYGDISPTTLGGRIIGVVIMFFGIGILGMFTATIASIFVEKKMKEDRGLRSYEFENHTILCEWNQRTSDILSELRADERLAEAPIVLIADLDAKPVDDENLYFIRGSVSEGNLKRANLAKANTVIIMGDDKLEPYARDAKVVLSTLTVETINPDAYTVVELAEAENAQHCRRANANDIIAVSEFSSRLISRTALDHGVTRVVSELLSAQYGNDLYKIPVPAALAGKSYLDVLAEMKRQHNCVVMAVQKGAEGDVISNPKSEQIVENGDYLIVISEERPKL